jgi:hypothetical protein
MVYELAQRNPHSGAARVAQQCFSDGPQLGATKCGFTRWLRFRRRGGEIALIRINTYQLSVEFMDFS